MAAVQTAVQNDISPPTKQIPMPIPINPNPPTNSNPDPPSIDPISLTIQNPPSDNIYVIDENEETNYDDNTKPTVISVSDEHKNSDDKSIQQKHNNINPSKIPANNNKHIAIAPPKFTKSLDVGLAIIKLSTCNLKVNQRISSTVGGLSFDDIFLILVQSKYVFQQQPMLLEIEAPINIVGDIHGQYPDLLRIFELGGHPPQSNYIFLGDYIDRGLWSLECILLLLLYKIQYPQHFFLLRGNHECASINKIYGFYHECKHRFPTSGVKLWRSFTDTFNSLPVAAVIDGKIFTMHGGLSPHLKSLQQINGLKRPTDIPDSGLLCDLLWSDPDEDITGWEPNDRGVSYIFGVDVLKHFLNTHDLDLIVRAHQVVEDGYEFFGDQTLVTIFSAPNYCGQFDNAGAMLSADESLMCSFQVLKPNPVKTKFIYQ